MKKIKSIFGGYTSLFVTSFVLAAIVVTAVPSISSAAVLYRQLQEGMSGPDVSSVQTFLAQDPSLYPQGLVTGYFGTLTKGAVSNFQRRNGIDPVGRIGPATLPVLNLQMAGGVSTNNRAPTIFNLSVSTDRNEATLEWSTDESAKGVVYYSTSPLVLVEHLNSVDVIGGNSAMIDTGLHTSQRMTISGLTRDTKYYFTVYVTDQMGNVSMTWPSTFTTSN